jgi:hypothetical protein
VAGLEGISMIEQREKVIVNPTITTTESYSQESLSSVVLVKDTPITVAIHN